MEAQATPAGRLQAYFEIVLTQTPDALKATDLDVIYALGALTGDELQASCATLYATVTLLWHYCFPYTAQL